MLVTHLISMFKNLVDSAKPVLREAIQISQQTPYWHCRLLFQLAVRKSSVSLIPMKSTWSLFQSCVSCSLSATPCAGEGFGVCLRSPWSGSRICKSHGLRVHTVNRSDLIYWQFAYHCSLSRIKFVLFFSSRALFLLSKGMVSWSNSLLFRGTFHVICVAFSLCVRSSAVAADGA